MGEVETPKTVIPEEYKQLDSNTIPEETKNNRVTAYFQGVVQRAGETTSRQFSKGGNPHLSKLDQK